MGEDLKEFHRYRGLPYMIIYVPRLKVGYKKSIMGLLWAILMPVLIDLTRRENRLLNGKFLGTTKPSQVTAITGGILK
jgi:ABC-type polysaccharide/polyol phosphate export permease